MAEPLWTFEDVLEATCGRAEGGGAHELLSVSIDSRSLEPGALFTAIRGEHNDGHDYVGQAFEAGAGAALVAQDAKLDVSGALIRVPDTLEALNRLGSTARARNLARIIAVTGSVGKTGTKEALRLALGASGRVYSSEKSYNNHWGVPLSLAHFARANDVGVIEVGMNHAGEIRNLARIARPAIGVVTNVGYAHIENFDSIDGVALAKRELIESLPPDGTAVLNADDPRVAGFRQVHGGEVITFGFSEDADVRAGQMERQGAGTRFRVRDSGWFET